MPQKGGMRNSNQACGKREAGRQGAAPHADGCAQLIAKCLLAGNMDTAQAWLEKGLEGRKGSLDKAFFHSLIHTCAKAGDPRAAGWCAQQMARLGMQLNEVTLNSVIDACAKAGDLQGATWWFEQTISMGLKPNGITYNTMIKACAQARDAAKAELWIQRMQEDGFWPCIVSYSTVIDAFAKTGKLEKAEAWFERMQDARVEPDAVIYNSLINACAKAGNPAKAEQWLLQMRVRSLRADAKTYNSVINACAKAGATQRAEHWFQRMQADGCEIDTITFGSVMHASAKVGNVARVEYWMEEMLQRGFEPNLVCYNTVLHSCAHGGNHKMALRWLKAMVEAGIEPNKITFNNVIDALVKAGELEQAQCWLRAMVEKGIHPDQITYVTLLRDYQHMKHKVPHFEEASHWAYGIIIRTYAAVGDFKMLQHWLLEMGNACVKPSLELLEECRRAALGAGNPPEAIAVLARLAALSAQANGAAPRQPVPVGRVQMPSSLRGTNLRTPPQQRRVAASVEQPPAQGLAISLSPISTAPSTPPLLSRELPAVACAEERAWMACSAPCAPPGVPAPEVVFQWDKLEPMKISTRSMPGPFRFASKFAPEPRGQPRTLRAVTQEAPLVEPEAYGVLFDASLVAGMTLERLSL